jgi:hypothetical protein
LGGGGGRGPGRGMGRRSSGMGGGGGGGGQKGILNHPAAFGLFFNFMFGGWEVAKAQQAIQEAGVMSALEGQPLGQLAAIRQGMDAATGGILGSIGGMLLDTSGDIFGHASPKNIRRAAMFAESTAARQDMMAQMQSARIVQHQMLRAGQSPHAQGIAAIDAAKKKKLDDLNVKLEGLGSETATEFSPNEFALDLGRRMRRMMGGSFNAEGLNDLDLAIGERYANDAAGRAGIRVDRAGLRQEERMIEADTLRDKIGLTKNSVLDRVGLQESMTAQAAAMDISAVNPYAQGLDLIGEAAASRAQTRDLKAAGMNPEALANDLLMRRRIDLAERQYLKHGFTTEQIDREMAIGMSPEEKGSLFSGFDSARAMMNGTLHMKDMPGMMGEYGKQATAEVEALRRLQESLERKLDELIGKLAPG